MICTNVQGPASSITFYQAHKSRSVRAMIPSTANMTGGFAVVSHCDTVKVSFIGDEGKCKESEEIIITFEEICDEILKS